MRQLRNVTFLVSITQKLTKCQNSKVLFSRTTEKIFSRFLKRAMKQRNTVVNLSLLGYTITALCSCRYLITEED